MYCTLVSLAVPKSHVITCKDILALNIYVFTTEEKDEFSLCLNEDIPSENNTFSDGDTSIDFTTSEASSSEDSTHSKGDTHKCKLYTTIYYSAN